MRWNWTQPDWPNFRYDRAAIEALERRFLLSSGEILGAVRHATGEERDRLRIELLSDADKRHRGRGSGPVQRPVLVAAAVRIREMIALQFAEYR